MRVPTQVTCFSVPARLARLNGQLQTRVCSSVGQSAPLIRVRSEVQILPDPPVLPRTVRAVRGHSSAGRAPALQAGGRRFDPGWLHQPVFARRAATHAPRAMHVWLHASSSRARPFFKNSEVVLTHLIQAMLMVSYYQPSFESCRIRESAPLTPGSLGLYGQANKRMWWMPRR
jgi:hypothetical protein